MICGTCGSLVTDPDTPFKDGVGIYCSGPCMPDQGEMVYHMPYLEEMASKCSVIVEIGCGHGSGSTRAFDRGLRRTTHPAGAKLFVSVDMEPHYPEVRPTIECFGKVTGDSREPSTKHRLIYEQFGMGTQFADLIYIDTDHTYQCMEAELENWKSIADSRTVWLFHDVFMFGTYNHMTDAIKDFCVVNPKWEYVLITEESHGMGMMRWRQ